MRAHAGFKLLLFFPLSQALLESSVQQPPDTSGKEEGLNTGLEKILAAAANLADAEATRDYRQHAIISQCSELKQKLKELLETLRSSDSVDGREDETYFERRGARAQGTAWELRKEVQYSAH